MKKKSAGILPFKVIDREMQFFIVHPGGPYFSKKDNGYWSIVKGEVEETEDALTAAKREFKEETSNEINGSFIDLGSVTLKSGKTVYGWAVEISKNFEDLKSNEFEIEWPPKSGLQKKFAEIDKYGWFNKKDALLKLNGAQADFIYRLLEIKASG